jgi:hypothetical protein
MRHGDERGLRSGRRRVHRVRARARMRGFRNVRLRCRVLSGRVLRHERRVRRVREPVGHRLRNRRRVVPRLRDRSSLRRVRRLHLHVGVVFDRLLRREQQLHRIFGAEHDRLRLGRQCLRCLRDGSDLQQRIVHVRRGEL